tara:strand:+ start:27080 stop:27859 length:780 start_codon:yes stop_codon:yes gene_type:complete
MSEGFISVIYQGLPRMILDTIDNHAVNFEHVSQIVYCTIKPDDPDIEEKITAKWSEHIDVDVQFRWTNHQDRLEILEEIYQANSIDDKHNLWSWLKQPISRHLAINKIDHTENFIVITRTDIDIVEFKFGNDFNKWNNKIYVQGYNYVLGGPVGPCGSIHITPDSWMGSNLQTFKRSIGTDIFANIDAYLKQHKLDWQSETEHQIMLGYLENSYFRSICSYPVTIKDSKSIYMNVISEDRPESWVYCKEKIIRNDYVRG